MGEGVRVNAVSPGPIRTAMPHPTRWSAERKSCRPAARESRMAEAIVWLLSPAASYVACANIRVAGGKP